MKIKVLGAFGGEGQGQRPSAFLIDDRVLVDAGSVPAALTVEEQNRIEYALLSHAHLDHVVGLAFLTDTLAAVPPPRPVTAASIEPVVKALHRHAFNGSLWPDFSKIPSPESPVLRFRTLAEETEARVGELWVTPILVDHTVPATGFIIHDGDTGFVYTGDTGPTERIWRAIRGIKGLKAVIVETAFPDRMEVLARASKHLTPGLLRKELDKIPPNLPLWIFHIKPQFLEETAEELQKIDPARIRVVEQGTTYTL